MNKKILRNILLKIILYAVVGTGFFVVFILGVWPGMFKYAMLSMPGFLIFYYCLFGSCVAYKDIKRIEDEDCKRRKL